MAESANEHVRVSEDTKERLQRRKQGDETFNEVIARLLDEDRDVFAGFDAADTRDGETLAETVARRKERSTGRIERLAEGRETDE